MSDIEAIVDDVLDALPVEFKKRLQNLIVLVDTDDPQTACAGRFQGEPVTGSSMFRVATSPSEIVIYAQALTRSCGDDTQRLRAAVEETVLHELGHYFGLTHAEMGAHLHV